MLRRGKLKVALNLISLLIVISIVSSCNTIDDDRIPNMPVSINLADPGLWNIYGVNGFGTFRYFIRSESQPSGFSYTAATYTGYGGILLVNGVDPFTNNTDVPLAYDLSCPVECQPTIRVYMQTNPYQAKCPVCGSVYNVVEGAGAPTDGPALTGPHKYGLRRYAVLRTNTNGYVITNR